MKNITSTLTDQFQNFSETTLFILLFVYAFFIRFPFFFRDYVDRDESTFILMGQSWAEGHLPFTELWDLKPPITFLFFACIISMFGKSFLAIRIAGTFLVATSAFYTYKIGIGLGYKKQSFLVSILVVILFSLFGSLQGVMSEHICMAFFMPAVHFFLFKKNHWWLFISGIFFGLSVMSKLNMAYPLLFLFLFEFTYILKKGIFYKQLSKLIIVGLGIILVVLCTALPYLYSDQLNIWWNSVVLAPLAYTKSGHGSVLNVLPFLVIVLSLLLFLHQKKFLNFKSKEQQSLLGIILGVLFSFVQAKKINGHYLLQLYPFLLLLFGVVISKLNFINKFRRTPWLFLLLLLIPMESYLEIGNIIKNKKETGSFFNGEGITVPQYLIKNNISYNNILFCEYHIGYWLLGETPPTKIATHPSNLVREELFLHAQNHRHTSKEELEFIIENQKPDLIVTRKNRRVFDKAETKANFYMNLILAKQYSPLDTIDNAVIHQRLPIQ